LEVKMDIYNEVKKILIEHLRINEEQLKPDSKLTDELGADSLDSIDIVMDLEEKFKIEIADEEVQLVKTVNDIVAIVEKKIKAKE